MGTIFNIQRFSLHDGPGIRTLIFTKGCPLRCKWCSNPEGLSQRIEVLCEDRKCIGCGTCLIKCPIQAITLINPNQYKIDRDLCTSCGKCVIFCPTGSKDFSGELKTVAEIVEIVKRDIPFYIAGAGGVTVGGGELLFQPEFSYGILKACKELKINTAIETSGFGKKSDLLKIVDVVDTIHFDIKAIDSEMHKKLTGIDNKIILENLKTLDKKLRKMSPKPRLIIRLPLIEGFNTTNENILQTAGFIKNNLIAYDEVEILVFHNLGERKYEQLDLPYELNGRRNANIEDYTIFVEMMMKKNLPVKLSNW